MSFVKKYLLPKEVDVNTALKRQAELSQRTIQDLVHYCLQGDITRLKRIIDDEHNSRESKHQNMRELLDVFITPYDKESIYRMINQLDWIALSVKHLAIEILAYEVSCPEYYKSTLSNITQMMEALLQAITYLPRKDLDKILQYIENIHTNYDDTIRQCALTSAKHLKEDDIKSYLANKEVLNQLKDVAKHIHATANMLEDMAMKIV